MRAAFMRLIMCNTYNETASQVKRSWKQVASSVEACEKNRWGVEKKKKKTTPPWRLAGTECEEGSRREVQVVNISFSLRPWDRGDEKRRWRKDGRHSYLFLQPGGTRGILFTRWTTQSTAHTQVLRALVLRCRMLSGQNALGSPYHRLWSPSVTWADTERWKVTHL